MRYGSIHFKLISSDDYAILFFHRNERFSNKVFPDKKRNWKMSSLISSSSLVINFRRRDEKGSWRKIKHKRNETVNTIVNHIFLVSNKQSCRI